MSIFFRWYNLWVGAYLDWPYRTLYVCPLPMVGVRIQLPHRHDWVPSIIGCDGSWYEVCTRCGAEREGGQ